MEVPPTKRKEKNMDDSVFRTNGEAKKKGKPKATLSQTPSTRTTMHKIRSINDKIISKPQKSEVSGKPQKNLKGNYQP